MSLQIGLLLIGFVVLIKGADFFVDGASNLARNFHLSKMLVGLTIVAFGTSAPEFAVSIQSMLSGSGEIVLGNVIGSNILNILLILGVTSMIHDLKVKNSTVKKEIPITLLISTVLIVLMSDELLGTGKNLLTRGDGCIILLFFSIFIYYLFSLMRNKKEEPGEEEKLFSLPKSILYTVFGMIAIIIGSKVTVDSATNLAKIFGVSERVIGLSIVAFGTSLPELVTSIIATKKKEYDIAIGNVIGSNIFNIGIVLGLPLALFGCVEVGSFNMIDLAFLFLSIFTLFLFSRDDYKLSKKEGAIFLLLFIVYYTLVIIG